MSVDDSDHERDGKDKCSEIPKNFHHAQKLSRVVIRPCKENNHRHTQHPVNQAYADKIRMREFGHFNYQLRMIQ